MAAAVAVWGPPRTDAPAIEGLGVIGVLGVGGGGGCAAIMGGGCDACGDDCAGRPSGKCDSQGLCCCEGTNDSVTGLAAERGGEARGEIPDIPVGLKPGIMARALKSAVAKVPRLLCELEMAVLVEKLETRLTCIVMGLTGRATGIRAEGDGGGVRYRIS